MSHLFMWQQGSVVQVRVTDLASNGNSIGRFQNRVVFFPDGVPGDLVSVRLLKIHRSYAEAKIIDIHQASESRIKPICILADKCGGCQWQNVSYTTQLAFKRKQVQETLRRIGDLNELAIGDIMQSMPFGYRNKVIYPLGRSKTGQITAGYYRKGTHRIVNANQCPVQDTRLDALLTRIKIDLDEFEIYDAESRTGLLKYLSMRIGQRTGEILITLVATTSTVPGLTFKAAQWMELFPSVTGVCVNIQREDTNRIFGQETVVIRGNGYVREVFCGLEFRLTSTAFFQINTDLAEQMIERVIENLEIKDGDTVVDGYAGVGTFVLPIAHRFPQTVCCAIDSYAESINCAQGNAKRNGIHNVTFKVGRFEDLLPEMRIQIDVVLLDPPRKGCDKRVLQTLLSVQPRTIIYMSCKPGTLARDLDILCHSGFYQCSNIIPIDMFPQTAHVETVVVLKRTKQQNHDSQISRCSAADSDICKEENRQSFISKDS